MTFWHHARRDARLPTQNVSAGLAEDTRFSAFYRDMDLPERRTFWACAVGWTLDGMDFMIFPLVLGTIITLWNVDAGSAGLAGTVTLLASAIGGWGAGYLADRIGRVRTLQLTVLWFSAFSLLCAFAQTFEQLLVLRALLGLGFGGEWAAGAILIGETVRAHIVGGRWAPFNPAGRSAGVWRCFRRRRCIRPCQPKPPGVGCSH